jgi:asparagine synthase (glutamine-hydrolysing)
MDLEKARRWSKTSREVWLASRVNMAGHLLQAKGDRVAMHSSVEVRYPFLDEDVFAYLAKLHPRWKLRGFTDKYILRRLAARYLPKSVYSRKKVIFRAPFDSFHMDPEPAFVAELLSDESLAKSGYFDAKSVRHWRQTFRSLKPGSLPRLTAEMGLTAVVATQLWYHTYIDGSLSSLPSQAGSVPAVAAA